MMMDQTTPSPTNSVIVQGIHEPGFVGGGGGAKGGAAVNSPSQGAGSVGPFTLYVGNLPFDATWQELKDLFGQVGYVVRADIPTSFNGRSRGFGTVTYGSEAEALAAIDAFHDGDMAGRRIVVRWERGCGPYAASTAPAGGAGVSAGDEKDRTLTLTHLPPGVGWQDLKDLVRQTGARVVRADVVSASRSGVVVVAGREDVGVVQGALHGSEWNGSVVSVSVGRLLGNGNGGEVVGVRQPQQHTQLTQGLSFSDSTTDEGAFTSTPPTTTTTHGARQLFIGNLPFSMHWQDLKDLVRPYGTPLRADIPLDPHTGRSRGFGQVVMTTAEEAARCIEGLNGREVDGRVVEVRVDKFVAGGGMGSGVGSGVGGSTGGGIGGTCLFVGNLPFSFRWQDLKDLFRPFNLLPLHAAIITESPHQVSSSSSSSSSKYATTPHRFPRSKGCGTVRFATPDEAQRAIAACHGLEVGGRAIVVRLDTFAL